MESIHDQSGFQLGDIAVKMERIVENRDKLRLSILFDAYTHFPKLRQSRDRFRPSINSQ